MQKVLAESILSIGRQGILKLIKEKISLSVEYIEIELST